MAATTSPRRRERVIERDSVLRASILDTALELGFGDNSSTVAKWMFSPLEEVDEEAESVVSPSLTYASTATSEESSSLYGPNFRHHRPGVGASNSISSQTNSLAKSDTLSSGGVSYSRNDGLTPEPGQRAIQFNLSNTPEPRAPSPMPTPSKSGKLRKTRPDGYESDAGYVSDSAKVKKEKEKEKKKSKKKPKEDGNAGDESDGGYLSEASVKKKKKEKKSKKEKESLDATMTDGESDGGYISMTFGRGKKERAAAKAAAMSPTTGDESDGAYLSESSVKKKSRFFRLNSKSSKKKNSLPNEPAVVPPVPSLPPMPMQLRIADMFSRSVTPSLDDSRDVTPLSSDRKAAEHSVQSASISSMSSRQVTVSSTHSASISSMDRIGTPQPPGSPQAIPNAFKDAESIRTPSTDLLSTFGRKNLPRTQSPSREKAEPIPTVNSNVPDSPSKSVSPLRIPAIPTITMPKPKRNPSMRTTPPQISAPNTRALAAKHTPVPLILTPPTPAASMRSFAQSSPAQSESSSTTPTPQNTASPPWTRSRSPDVARGPSPLTVSTSSASSTNQYVVRPHVLAYYDLPPPSPPPTGPLPKLPPSPQPSMSRHDWSQQRAPSPIWKTDPFARGPSPSPSSSKHLQPSGSASPLFLQRSPSRGRESPFPTAASPSPTSGEPLTRVTSRGREAPFPTQPVLPRAEGAELVRRTSIARAASPVGGTRPLRIGAKLVNISGPMSADAFTNPYTEPSPVGLDARWQPRSASALDTRPSEDSRRSWIDYDDGNDFSRASSDEQDLSQEGSASIYHDDDPNSSVDQGPPADEERSTQYFDAEDSDEGEGNRYSVWSAKSRVSILDKQRSGDVRQKFVQRVEAMYGKSVIPPVPKLPPAPKPGMF
ncbi:hypothetical protein BXZ70DRAFT_522665 [Cristinia sonorae]|uniref:Uncharacterized protein n=1 Tax=Cristinia sonorae TaxID=1940300 RepID=A0A8K0UXM8_9AGAR|nr:hypothetical protein BXZ70DRAFT_522665 [Cristinia sonorae]